MAGFDWDEETQDPPDAGPEPSMFVPADVLPENDEAPELTEVERRLEKAHFYRMLLKHQLISSDSTEAIEVEEEIQDFVRERLSVLLGIKTDSAKQNLNTFTNEEVEALKAVAAKVLKKPTIVAAPVQSTPTIKPVEEPKVAPVRPTPPAPRLISETSTTPPKRGRGRPRKNPQAAPIAKSEPAPQDENAGERIKVVGGKRYKVVDRVINDPATGKPRIGKDGKPMTAEHLVDITPKVKLNTTPLPSQEIINAMESAKAAEVLAQNNIAVGLIPTAMQLPDTTRD